MFSFFSHPIFQVFAADPCGRDSTFFGLIPWYKYLDIQKDSTGHCAIQNFTVLSDKSSFLLIAMAIVDDLLRIAAWVAIGFVIWGGAQYITSQGSPDAASKAQSTIINALIGLAIALIATAVVSFFGNKFGG